MPETVGKSYSKNFLFLFAICFVFLLICVLAASFLNVISLLTFGLLYLFMLLSCLFVWNLQVEPEKHFFTAYFAGIISLFGLSVLFGIFTQQSQTLGMLSTLDTANTTPSLSPEQAWAFFINIPGPVAEEACFRIFLWRLVTLRLGGVRGLIAQAVAFGFFHFFAFGQNPVTMLLAICAGLALGVIYMLSGNELAVTTSHLTYNIIILLIEMGVFAV